MAKAITKLFRDPKSAEKAVKDLLTDGFEVKEISMLLRQGENAHLLNSIFQGIDSVRTSLPEIGQVIGVGPLASVLQQADPGSALTESLGITRETYEYYHFGILVGGILVIVHDSDERLRKAQAILRAAVPKPRMVETGAKSPGFTQAERMNATNPLDAPMSGDFRKY